LPHVVTPLVTANSNYDCYVLESVAYSFGHAGGLVTFTFAAGEWPDTRTDQVALGLMTTQGNTVIFRMTSGSSSDFMEMEIVGRYLNYG